MSVFRTQFAKHVCTQKYLQHIPLWPQLCRTLAFEVCNGLLPKDWIEDIAIAMSQMKILAGGRYLFYAGRSKHFYNNCFILRSEEDSREDWAQLSYHSESCLLTGGGIGNDYSRYRPANSPILGTGGVASGPIPKMMMINEIGRRVMQGGSRRSAIYGSLNWDHADAPVLLHVKDWDQKIPGTNVTMREAKQIDFNWPCPLDMTNISLNYSDNFDPSHEIFLDNVRQACRTGEPGFSFNFGAQANETLRNACTEIVSEDDSDVCNLGSVNLGRIDSKEELATMTALLTSFLICGGIRADLPYAKVYEVRAKNNRIGVGLMGLHEWLIKRKLPYAPNAELEAWLETWRDVSNSYAATTADRLSVVRPKGIRAVAPTGTIGLIADTSTGIEPLYAVAYKRRFLTNGTQWNYQFVVDATAQHMVDEYGVDPDSIETALGLSKDVRRRLKMQALVQKYTDMSIASTVNLPAWGSETNNEDTVSAMAGLIAEFAPKLRGLTVYPDGARGGQPLTAVPYADAKCLAGETFVETHDVCQISGRGGSCGS